MPQKANGAQTQAQAAAPAAAPKVVGPNVYGKREEYQLVRHLQSALFGGVYEAKGLSSGRDFAIKVLHKSELSKAEETQSIEFCEVPLSEIRFADLMKGHEHVMEPEEHFEDAFCHYVVFMLCQGGDLLEALKQKPHGFDEPHAQFLIQQAAKGLAFLHRRGVAMQDTSLENMLLNVNPINGHYQVKICDPGQAATFKLDPQTGDELPVEFGGLVGKSFRPPELHDQCRYQATKVDSWCLGWSTFYLLTAQPLFMSADPAQKDADWALFQQGDYIKLFQQKSNLCSHVGLDFIFRLMQLDPSQRMSIAEALEHPWLADTQIAPVLAPKELLPESLRKGTAGQRDAEAQAATGGTGDSKDLHDHASLQVASPGLGHRTSVTSAARRSIDGSNGAGHVASAASIMGGGSSTGSIGGMGGLTSPGGLATGTSLTGSIHWAGSPGDLPTWATANSRMAAGVHSPVSRVRSPMRAPRPSAVIANAPHPQQLALDRRVGQRHPGSAARTPHVIATAHSPPPAIVPMSPIVQRTGPRQGPRAASPLQSSPDVGPRSLHQGGSVVQIASQHQVSQQGEKPPWPAFLTPRSASRPKFQGSVTDKGVKADGPDGENMHPRDRAWAFRSEADQKRMPSGIGSGGSDGRSRAVSPTPVALPTAARVIPGNGGYTMPAAQGRAGQSPARTSNTIQLPRSPSPMQVGQMLAPTGMRAASPVGGGALQSRNTGGFSWAQAPVTYSPRVAGANAASPMGTRAPSPVGAVGRAPQMGFAWSPDPPSPRIDNRSPRTFSPMPSGAMVFPQGQQQIRGLPTNQLRR